MTYTKSNKGITFKELEMAQMSLKRVIPATIDQNKYITYGELEMYYHYKMSDPKISKPTSVEALSKIVTIESVYVLSNQIIEYYEPRHDYYDTPSNVSRIPQVYYESLHNPSDEGNKWKFRVKVFDKVKMCWVKFVCVSESDKTLITVPAYGTLFEWSDTTVVDVRRSIVSKLVEENPQIIITVDVGYVDGEWSALYPRGNGAYVQYAAGDDVYNDQGTYRMYYGYYWDGLTLKTKNVMRVVRRRASLSEMSVSDNSDIINFEDGRFYVSDSGRPLNYKVWTNHSIQASNPRLLPSTVEMITEDNTGVTGTATSVTLKDPGITSGTTTYYIIDPVKLKRDGVSVRVKVATSEIDQRVGLTKSESEDFWKSWYDLNNVSENLAKTTFTDEDRDKFKIFRYLYKEARKITKHLLEPHLHSCNHSTFVVKWPLEYQYEYNNVYDENGSATQFESPNTNVYTEIYDTALNVVNGKVQYKVVADMLTHTNNHYYDMVGDQNAVCMGVNLTTQDRWTKLYRSRYVKNAKRNASNVSHYESNSYNYTLTPGNASELCNKTLLYHVRLSNDIADLPASELKDIKFLYSGEQQAGCGYGWGGMVLSSGNCGWTNTTPSNKVNPVYTMTTNLTGETNTLACKEMWTIGDNDLQCVGKYVPNLGFPDGQYPLSKTYNGLHVYMSRRNSGPGSNVTVDIKTDDRSQWVNAPIYITLDLIKHTNSVMVPSKASQTWAPSFNDKSEVNIGTVNLTQRSAIAPYFTNTILIPENIKRDISGRPVVIRGDLDIRGVMNPNNIVTMALYNNGVEVTHPTTPTVSAYPISGIDNTFGPYTQFNHYSLEYPTPGNSLFGTPMTLTSTRTFNPSAHWTDKDWVSGRSVMTNTIPVTVLGRSARTCGVLFNWTTNAPTSPSGAEHIYIKYMAADSSKPSTSPRHQKTVHVACKAATYFWVDTESEDYDNVVQAVNLMTLNYVSSPFINTSSSALCVTPMGEGNKGLVGYRLPINNDSYYTPYMGGGTRNTFTLGNYRYIVSNQGGTPTPSVEYTMILNNLQSSPKLDIAPIYNTLYWGLGGSVLTYSTSTQGYKTIGVVTNKSSVQSVYTSFEVAGFPLDDSSTVTTDTFPRYNYEVELLVSDYAYSVMGLRFPGSAVRVSSTNSWSFSYNKSNLLLYNTTTGRLSIANMSVRVGSNSTPNGIAGAFDVNTYISIPGNTRVPVGSTSFNLEIPPYAMKWAAPFLRNNGETVAGSMSFDSFGGSMSTDLYSHINNRSSLVIGSYASSFVQSVTTTPTNFVTPYGLSHQCTITVPSNPSTLSRERDITFASYDGNNNYAIYTISVRQSGKAGPLTPVILTIRARFESAGYGNTYRIFWEMTSNIVIDSYISVSADMGVMGNTLNTIPLRISMDAGSSSSGDVEQSTVSSDYNPYLMNMTVTRAPTSPTQSFTVKFSR